MKTLNTLTTLSFLVVLCCFTGCEKSTPSANSANCYKATLIAIDCAYIVKVEGVNIGATWRGIQNCVTVSNLPADAKQIGSTLYFTSYGPGSGPYCTADKIYDFPLTTIELLNYSKTGCIEP